MGQDKETGKLTRDRMLRRTNEKGICIILAIAIISCLSIYTFAAGSYGDLNFEYPLPSSYTTLYNKHSSSHYGLDFKAGEGTSIYAIDGGVVKYAGGVTYTGENVGSAPHNSMGWFATITHDSTDPNGTKRLIARYLHMWEAPYVRSGDEVYAGQLIGEVGNTGSSTANHLHLDINSKGLYWGGSGSTGINYSTSINPALFWPDVFSSRLLQNSGQVDEVDIMTNALVEGRYIDASLVEMVGMGNVVRWLDQTPAGNADIISFIDYFEITPEQFNAVVQSNNLQSTYSVQKIFSLKK